MANHLRFWTRAGLAALLLCAPVAAPAQAPGSVDDQRLKSAGEPDGNWITFGRDYSNQRFAPMDGINRQNVAHLAPAWIYQLGLVGSVQTHPLVVDGVMYISMPGNDVAAINAATGAEIWRYRHQMQGKVVRAPSNRGVAVAYGHVFEATDDERVIALDQATGKLVWDQKIHPFDASALVPAGQKKPDVPFEMRAAPLAYDGKLLIGTTGFEANQFDANFVKASLAAGTDVGADWINANLARRGFLSALDAATGAETWRWYTTKEDGWEGDYVETTPDGMPLHRDIKAEKAAAIPYKNAWAAGSNSTWMTPAVDPAMGLLFITTGNPAPGDVDLVRPGDNLYANGLAAIDARTGALRWFLQESPHGQYDAISQAVLLEVPVGGRTVAAVMNCSKAGWCFVADRASGKLLFRSDEVVPHQNTYAAWSSGMSAAPEGVPVAPGGQGGVGVSPVSYDPTSGIVYVASIHRPVVMTLENLANSPGFTALTKITSRPMGGESFGTLTALDLRHGGRALWQVKTPEPLVGGTLATAGGLVFTGEANGHFDAYDSATGKLLWSYQTGANVGAPPMSYSVGGRQFIAVATGAAASGRGGGLRPGGAIVAFALPE